MEEYTLCCFVPGEKDTFPVDINERKTVGQLKKAIKNEKPHKFKDFDADELTLHQIKIIIPDDDEGDNILDGVSQPGYVFDPKRKLFPTSKISRYFGQDPEGDIHILVELPQGRSIEP